MQRILIFDIGDVLVTINVRRFFKEFARAFQISQLRLVLQFDKRIFEGLMDGSRTMPDVHRTLCEQFKREIPYARFLKAWVSMLDQPKAEVIQLIENLRTRYQLAILSNTESCHYEHLRANMPWLQYFTPHFLSYELRLTKPQPEIFLRVLQELNARPEECFFIDDKKENVRAAQNLGIPAHQFKNHRRLNKALQKQALI